MALKAADGRQKRQAGQARLHRESGRAVTGEASKSALGSHLAEEFRNAFQQPFHGKWLADVVVNAKHFCIRLVPAPFVGRHHDDPQGVVVAPTESLEHEKSAAFGHHHIEHHQIGLFPFGECHTLIAIAGNQYRVPFGLEDRPHRLDDFSIVVDEENSFFRCGSGRLAGGGGLGTGRFFGAFCWGHLECLR